MTDAWGRTFPAPRIHASIALFALAVSACHARPPQIVPPPPASVKVRALRLSIDAVLAAPALSRGIWGVDVRSLAGGETLYALNVHKLMMPASTEKVVTLAVAADQLGWDYTYRTSVFAVGSVEDGVLKGDLVVVGSGDPTFDDWDGFATGRFAEWATALKGKGIQKIDGRIIGDDNAFDDEGLGPGWGWDDLAASFATGVGALQFNQNTAQLVITPAAPGEPAHVQVTPDAAQLTIRNRTTTGAGAPLSVRPIPHTSTIELIGTVAPASPRTLRNVAVPNATLYYVNAVRNGLIRNGVEVAGPAVDVDELDAPVDRSKGTLTMELESRNLTAVATTMMKMSQNLYAETLLKTIGAHASGVGSTVAGRAVLDAALATWGVAAGEVQEVDGSGLSRYNLVTPDALATVLRHVYQDERLREPFVSTLPRAGVDGTLAERMKGTAAADNVQAKTGSFTNARSVAGYVRTADGEMLEFVVMANNYGAPTRVVDDATDAILVTLANFTRK